MVAGDIGGAVGVDDQQRIYLFGSRSRVQVYDVATDTWSDGPVFPTPDPSTGYLKAALVGRTVHLTGGDPSGATVLRHDTFNVDTLTFGTAAAVPNGIWLGHVAASDGTYLYLAGGSDLPVRAGGSATPYRYNPATNTWATFGTPLNSWNTRGAVVGGKLFVVGGTYGFGITPDTDVYVIGTATWHSLAETSTVGVDAACAGPDGNLYYTLSNAPLGVAVLLDLKMIDSVSEAISYLSMSHPALTSTQYNLVAVNGRMFLFNIGPSGGPHDQTYEVNGVPWPAPEWMVGTA